MLQTSDSKNFTDESTSERIISTLPDNLLSEHEAICRCTAPPQGPLWDLPASPPGSASPTLEKKFAHFRALKQNNIHLNANLDQSLSFQNPRLLDKLVDYVGINNLYGSNLPEDLQTWIKLPSTLKASNLAKALDHQSAQSSQRTDIRFVPEQRVQKSTR